MRFDLVAAALSLSGFIVLASAPSPGWGNLGAGGTCAFLALIFWSRFGRRTKASSAQVSLSPPCQQVSPSAPTPFDELRAGTHLDGPHTALLNSVQTGKL